MTTIPPSLDAPRPPSRRWGDVVRVIAGVLGGAIVASAITAAVIRPPATTVSVSDTQPSTTVARSSRAGESAQIAAIRDVIQRANDEQAQAIARNDPTVMRDSATAAHYQDLLKTNDDLTSGGVVSIKLVKLEWGAIDVSGATARAVTYETWQSTFRDGSVDQSRDENDYSLVLQDGKWVVDGDDQPAADGQTAPSGRSDPNPAVPPLAPSRDTSSNWSGYAATGGTFTSVTATWTVPDPSTSTTGVDATWVGIGGIGSHDLIQAGTQASVSGRSSVRFGAWIEMLPQTQETVPLTVAPGDSVTVSIAQQQGDAWLISMKDDTTGRDYSTTVHYTSSRSSAEWIEEAPSGGRRVLPLDDFGTVSFTDAKATKDGTSMTIAAAGGRPLTMINSARQPLAQSSTLGPDGSSFTVTRTAAPSNVAPQTPVSPGRGRRGG
jgi:peptidase A4-like protein